MAVILGRPNHRQESWEATSNAWKIQGRWHRDSKKQLWQMKFSLKSWWYGGCELGFLNFIWRRKDYLQFRPKSWYVNIAGFDVSPCTATSTSPLSVTTRRKSQLPLNDPRLFENCNWTERNSMSSIGSTGILLLGKNKKADSEYLKTFTLM